MHATLFTVQAIRMAAPSARALRPEGVLITMFTSPEAINDTASTPRSAAPILPTSVSTLTPREREILQLIAEGRGSKQVADALGISVKTVETHRANLMRKLAIHSVSELVRYAIREKIAAP